MRHSARQSVAVPRSQLWLRNDRCWVCGGLLGLLVLLLWPAVAMAHSIGHDTDARPEWWLRWSWNPLVLSNLAVVSLVYLRGLQAIWLRAGRGRGVSFRQAVTFGAGILSLFIALISPLDSISGELQSAHMVQHMILMNVAAPLLVLGAPGLVMMWGLPMRWRNRMGRWLRWLDGGSSRWYLLWQPVLLWSLFAFALWIWHLPVLYQAALRNQLFHDFQHFTFLITACLFWRVLLDPISRLRLTRAMGVLYLFMTSLHATLLGVFMALAPRVWYSDYEGSTTAWNLTPLQDQQLAGLIMWMPACMIYAVVAALVFALWLRIPESEAAQQEAELVQTQ
jgi:putative membrane protein